MMIPCKERTLAVIWTVQHLGLPDGFSHWRDYADYVDALMDRAEYNEVWLLDEYGTRCAYFAWCLSEDIHHKGTIFDVTNVVIRPGAKCASKLWRNVYALAQAENCEWVSRCVHNDDGSITNTFKRI